MKEYLKVSSILNIYFSNKHEHFLYLDKIVGIKIENISLPFTDESLIISFFCLEFFLKTIAFHALNL